MTNEQKKTTRDKKIKFCRDKSELLKINDHIMFSSLKDSHLEEFVENFKEILKEREKEQTT